MLVIISACVVCGTKTAVQAQDETQVTFPDTNLEAAIREAIDKPEGIIFTSDLDGLTSLKTKGITDLTGLEYCNNLTELVLDYSRISDLTPLASLTNLTELRLWDNEISDIAPLENLTNLTQLELGYNQISDLSPLASLANLTKLYLNGNQISDISPLTNLTTLTQLELGRNQISDISPLANLTNLTRLDLGYNQISDLSPLLSLPSLKTLHIRYGNPLSETSLKVHIPQLKKRGVSIPREKTSLGYLNIGHLLIPLFVLVAALVAVLLGYPTQHERRARRRRKWLVAGVIVAGLYTFCALVAVAAGGMQPIDLEDLLLFVVAPGLFLYGGVAVAWFLWSTREQKQQHCRANLTGTVQCESCGHDNPPEASFCGNCGAPVTTKVEPTPPAAAPLPRGVPRKWLLIGGLAILIMAGLGYGVTSLLKAPPPPPPAPAPIPAPVPIPPPPTGPETVTFADGNLEAAIRDALGKPPGKDITTTELAELTELLANESGITNLSGLEHCANLIELRLERNEISDISPLENLTSLTWLDLERNEISDISPLQNLTSLTDLTLGENQISDISPLENLNSLTELTLGENQISDISPLVENSGLGTGDKIWLEDSNLDLSEGSEDMDNIRALEDRGVIVEY